MGVNPNDDGTVVNAPLEWLAFRGLPAFPCVPIGNRIVTCGVTGRRQDELQFHWPLWSCEASYATLRSLLVLAAVWVTKDQDANARSRCAAMAHGIGAWLLDFNGISNARSRSVAHAASSPSARRRSAARHRASAISVQLSCGSDPVGCSHVRCLGGGFFVCSAR